MNAYILNNYFQALRTTQSEEETERITQKIWEIWMQTGKPQLDAKMDRACEMLLNEEVNDAISLFTQIVKNHPDFAEGWNKRATAYYLRGEYKKAIEDIQEALKLEPRHFGALSGWATICLIINDMQCALNAFEMLKAIHPHKKGLDNKISMLKEVLEEDKQQKEK